MAVKTAAYPAMRRLKKATGRNQLVSSVITEHVHTVLPRVVLASGESSDDSDSSYEGDSSEQSDEEGETASSEGDSSEDTDEEEETGPERILVRGKALEPPSPKRRREIKEATQCQVLQSGMYPTFVGTHGPSQGIDPRHNNALEYLQRLWTLPLCELIADETNRYMLKRQAQGLARKAPPTTAREVWTFLGIILAMGVHGMSRYSMFWSNDEYLGVEPIKQCMTRDRFDFLRRHLHLVNDDDAMVDKSDRHYRVKPLVHSLQTEFLRNYSPTQEIVVDELMIKCKGRAKGRVVMPKKPVKRGFKMWSLSCSCCGYLCNFQLYAGKCTAKPEKGLAKRVVLDLVEPFEGINHVLYLDNYFTSVDLTVALRKKHIYTVGTVKSDSVGLPACLKGKKLKFQKGDYKCVTVGTGVSQVNCFAYEDRKLVRFMTNAFPPSMTTKAPVRKLLVKQTCPPLVPAYNKFMGGVDRTGQLRKSYGNDHRCKRPWLRIFFHLFDIAVSNAHLLYKHNCNRCSIKPRDSLAFRMELVHCLLDSARKPHKRACLPQPCPDAASEPCRLVRVNAVDGLKRGKCHYCQQKQLRPCKHTSFACCNCRVRLCKIGCYDAYHKL